MGCWRIAAAVVLVAGGLRLPAAGAPEPLPQPCPVPERAAPAPGEVCGWCRPGHHGSAAIVEMLRGITEGQAEVFRDPRSGIIYWRGTASADTLIRARLGMGPAEATTVPAAGDHRLTSKLYLLRHADPYELRAVLREAVQATRTSGVPTGVEALRFNDGTGALLVTAEAYRFCPGQPGGGMSLDDLVAKLDQPGAAAGDDAGETILVLPAQRSAAGLAEGLHNLGLNHAGDPQELDAGDDEVFVDPELNVVLVKTTPSGGKRVREVAAVLDRPLPQVRLVCRAYELQAGREKELEAEYQAWRNGPGAALLAAGHGGDGNSATVYCQFAPRWDARFFESLASAGRAVLLTSGEGVVRHGQEFSIGNAAPDAPGIHLRLRPALAAEHATLFLQAAFVDTLPSGQSLRTGCDTQVALPARGGRVVLGGLERRVARESGWWSWLFGDGPATAGHRIVLVVECHPAP